MLALASMLGGCHGNDVALDHDACADLVGQSSTDSTMLRLRNASAAPAYLASDGCEVVHVFDSDGQRIERGVPTCTLACATVLADSCEIACSTCAAVVRLEPGAVIEEPWGWTRFVEVDLAPDCAPHALCHDQCAVERTASAGPHQLQVERFAGCPYADPAACTCAAGEDACGLFSLDPLQASPAAITVSFTHADVDVELVLP